MWQLVPLLTSSPTFLFLALPYWSPCWPRMCRAHFYSWASLLIFPFVFFFPNNCDGQVPQFFAQMLSSQETLNTNYLIKIVHSAHLFHIYVPCSFSSSCYLLTYYLHIACIIICFSSWSISCAREQFWFLPYLCIPGLVNSVWHTVCP